MSIDPLASNFPWQSPYTSMDNNPVNIIDPTGESGIVIKDEKNKTLTVKSTNVYYGKNATRRMAKENAKSIENAWNEAGGKIIIGGEEYSVIFKVKGRTTNVIAGKVMSFIKGNRKGTQNDRRVFGKTNYIEVGEDQFSITRSDVGGSNGQINPNDFNYPEGKTAAHEQGHFWWWYDKSQVKETYGDGGGHNTKPNDDGTPNIMQDRDQDIVPKDRKVKQADVEKITIDKERLENKRRVKVGKIYKTGK